MRRTIVIGDVHGCIDELRELLRRIDASPEDRLISVGDLICKGPDSRAVLQWAMGAKNLLCVRGNHESRFLTYWKLGIAVDVKEYDLETYRQLGKRLDDFMRFIESWPLFLLEPDLVVVHAGFDPRQPIAGQPASRLTELRRLAGTDMPWYEEYTDERLVVFGHWAKPEPIVRSNAIGLDTGCVYGGALSALILPERRIVSVPARRVYREKANFRVSAV